LFLVYADVNIIWGSVYTVKKIAKALVVADKKTGLEVYADKQDQNAGWSHNIKTDNSCFEELDQFKYIGTTLTNQDFIQEEVKSRLKSGNAGFHTVQNLFSLLSKNFKIKIHRTIIWPVVFFGGATWSLTLRVEHRLRVLRMFGPKRNKV
jgi:hypothetical protein